MDICATYNKEYNKETARVFQLPQRKSRRRVFIYSDEIMEL